MKVTTFAVDLAKRVFQVHGFSAMGEKVVARRLRREEFLRYFAEHGGGCRVAMEACGSAHYWARELTGLGYEVRVIPAQFTAAFVIGNKRDASDADAIFEASRRAQIRPVPIKSEEQQAIQALHRVRARQVRSRTALMNQLRGLLAEFGYVFAAGAGSLLRGVETVVEQGQLPWLMAEQALELREEWRLLDERIRSVDRRLKALYGQLEVCQRLGEIDGVGVLTATAIVARVDDAGVFHGGRQFSAWVGLTPRESSSGEQRRLGAMTRRGDTYLRTLLMHGARAVVHAARRRSDPRSRWIQELVARRGVHKAIGAVANKNARIIWALLQSGERYRPPGAAI